MFVKRIPITDVELARPYSTRNHFKLPTYFSYGVGSAGFGVWRELALHVATADEDGFPRLLHHRVVECAASGATLPMKTEEFVRYWNNNAAIGQFMEARANATHQLCIVLEHVPHLAGEWVFDHHERAEELLAQVFASLDVLRERGIVHFDSHFGNVVTDGKQARLTDFGLGMSRDFELTAEERRFLQRHKHYDYGLTLAHLGMLTMDRLGVAFPYRSADVDQLANAEAFPALASLFTRHRAPIAYMVDFLMKMRRPSKRARYDDAVLGGLLKDAKAPL